MVLWVLPTLYLLSFFVIVLVIAIRNLLSLFEICYRYSKFDRILLEPKDKRPRASKEKEGISLSDNEK